MAKTSTVENSGREDFSGQQLVHAQHVPAAGRMALSLVLVGVSDPRNVGSLFRIADAFAIERIYLDAQSASPPNIKLRKTSRSTERHVPYTISADVPALLEHKRSAGYRVLALEITEDSQDIAKLALQSHERVILVLGNEQLGVPQSVLNCCQQALHIPMRGHNSSMNVAVVGGIAAHVVMCQLSPVFSSVRS